MAHMPRFFHIHTSWGGKNWIFLETHSAKWLGQTIQMHTLMAHLQLELGISQPFMDTPHNKLCDVSLMSPFPSFSRSQCPANSSFPFNTISKKDNFTLVAFPWHTSYTSVSRSFTFIPEPFLSIPEYVDRAAAFWIHHCQVWSVRQELLVLILWWSQYKIRSARKEQSDEQQQIWSVVQERAGHALWHDVTETLKGALLTLATHKNRNIRMKWIF